MILTFFLDTNALMCIAGLQDSELQAFKTRLEETSSELSVTHVQVDEMYERELRPYQMKIEKALSSLADKGIIVQVEPSKIPVQGIARQGYTKAGGEEVRKLYNELRIKIDACQRTKGQPKTLLNVASDATIAISSLEHDFFISCDRCLCDSWNEITTRQKKALKPFNVPLAYLVKRSPKKVAKCILQILS